MILESLVKAGKKALEAKVEDFVDGGKGVAKVLSAEEVRNWRDSSGGGTSDHDAPTNTKEDGTGVSKLLHVPQSDDDEFKSEDEVELMTVPVNPTSSSPAAPPPILIIESL